VLVEEDERHCHIATGDSGMVSRDLMMWMARILGRGSIILWAGGHQAVGRVNMQGSWAHTRHDPLELGCHGSDDARAFASSTYVLFAGHERIFLDMYI
jgi:hypothetical protein